MLTKVIFVAIAFTRFLVEAYVCTFYGTYAMLLHQQYRLPIFPWKD